MMREGGEGGAESKPEQEIRVFTQSDWGFFSAMGGLGDLIF